jgi:hypothetical protein
MPDLHAITLELTAYQVVQLRHAVANWASDRHGWRMDRLHAGDVSATRPTAQEIAAEQVADMVWKSTEEVADAMPSM